MSYSRQKRINDLGNAPIGIVGELQLAFAHPLRGMFHPIGDSAGLRDDRFAATRKGWAAVRADDLL